MCLDSIDACDEVVEWPHCRHVAHTRCAFYYLRSQRPPRVGELWPSLARIQRVRCPVRGEVSATFGAVEACMQQWGQDAEAETAYAHLTASFVPAPQDVAPPANTAQAAVQSYATLTYSAADVPPPECPEALIPLCHHLVGGPPNFEQLQDRSMPWSPVSIRGSASGAYRAGFNNGYVTRAQGLSPYMMQPLHLRRAPALHVTR